MKRYARKIQKRPLHLHRNFKGNLILGNYYSTDSFCNNTTTYSVLMYSDVKLNNLSFSNMFQIQPESLFYLNDWIESNRGIAVSVSLNCSSHSRKNCYLLNRFRPFSFLFFLRFRSLATDNKTTFWLWSWIV